MSITPQPNRRRIHLVDHVLQKYLLGALVMLEVGVAVLAIWALYQALGEIVDQNMYRIHFSGDANILALMMREGLRVLGGILLVNLLALVVADRIWAYYVDGIVRQLTGLMHASHQLDFSAQEAASFQHAVLDQALAWRAAESAHWAKVRARIRQLPVDLPTRQPERDAIAQALAALPND